VGTFARRAVARTAFVHALAVRLTRRSFMVVSVMAVLLMRALPGAIAIAAARRALTFEVARARAVAVFAGFSAAFRRPAGNAIAIGIP
jgi:hypothetical protein